MNGICADVFAPYLKTKNFHWHMSGPHFRDYHLLLDEHADQMLAITDAIAERVRKVGGSAIKSIGHVSRTQRIADNDADSSNRRTCSRSFQASLVISLQLAQYKRDRVSVRNERWRVR